jgi:DNA (cytosine-5)-methyltransferase 1
MEGNVRMYRAKIEAGEMTETEAEAILGKSVWEAQGAIPMMWPTPTVDDASNVNPKPNRFRGLVAAVNETWPTPTASDWKGRGPNSKQQGLSEVVKYPTPLASGGGGTGHWNKIENLYLDGQVTYEEKMAMQAGNGGRLNPTWVEWLMGFPTGWTDLEDLGTL